MGKKSKQEAKRDKNEKSGGGCCSCGKPPDDDANNDTDFTDERHETPEPDTSKQIRNVSRVYADALEGVDRKLIESRKFKVEWNSDREIVLGRRVGQGHFSNVYAAVDVETNTKIVAKVLKPASHADRKIVKEIMALEYVRGGPNIVELIDTVVDDGKKMLLFEKVNYVPSQKLFAAFTRSDVQQYGLQLLKALDWTHSRGVMHRDVKPANVLIDPVKKMLRLADWGVAGFYVPTAKQQRGPGTRSYKSPEMALRWDHYDYGCDLWAYGLFFASMIFHHHGSLVRGHGGWFNQLRGIAEVVGTAPLVKLMKRLQIKISREQMDKLTKIKQIPMRSRISSATKDLCSAEAMDLLSKLLEVDPTDRLTAREAMAHPFFAGVADLSMGSDDEDGEASSSGDVEASAETSEAGGYQSDEAADPSSGSE